MRAAPALSRAEREVPAPWRCGPSSALAPPVGHFHFHKKKRIWLNLRYESVSRRGSNEEGIERTERPTETRRRRARGPRDMVEQKKRMEGTDTEQREVKALRQEVEGLKLRIAKFEAESQTPQEEDKEVKLPTEVWAIIAGKLDQNDVCSFALVSKQLREAQVLAGRKLVTKLKRTRYFLHFPATSFNLSYFTEDWCAYWSRKFYMHETDPELIKRVLYVAARQGYLQVFEKYWSQGPQEKLSQLWDEETCGWAALHGHLEVLQWLRAKGCPWWEVTSKQAALGGHLEVLQWMRAQDPPCPWKRDWFGMAGRVTAKRKLAQKSMKRKNRYCREAVNLHPASMYKDTNLPPPRPKVCLSVRSSKRIHLSLTASSRCSGVQGRRLVRHDTHLLQAIASSIIFLHFC